MQNKSIAETIASFNTRAAVLSPTYQTYVSVVNTVLWAMVTAPLNTGILIGVNSHGSTEPHVGATTISSGWCPIKTQPAVWPPQLGKQNQATFQPLQSKGRSGLVAPKPLRSTFWTAIKMEFGILLRPFFKGSPFLFNHCHSQHTRLKDGSSVGASSIKAAWYGNPESRSHVYTKFITGLNFGAFPHFLFQARSDFLGQQKHRGCGASPCLKSR